MSDVKVKKSRDRILRETVSRLWPHPYRILESPDYDPKVSFYPPNSGIFTRRCIGLYDFYSEVEFEIKDNTYLKEVKKMSKDLVKHGFCKECKVKLV